MSGPKFGMGARLYERSGWQRAVVALTNKNARILWALMTRGEAGYAPLAWQVGRLHDAFAGKYTTTSLARGVNWL